MTSGFIRLRFSYVLESYLKRWNRLGSHLFFQKSIYRIPLDKWYDWPIDLMFHIIDVLLICDIADMVMNGLKDMRRLSEEELVVVKDIFSHNINERQIFIWEKAKPLKKGLYHAFVSFNTIQSIKPLDIPILIHEIVHVWQYQRFGSVYIYRALKAQNSKKGYDYGGCDHLIKCLESNIPFLNFNFEQQAEIIEDYVRMHKSKQPLVAEVRIYEPFVQELDYKSKLG